MNGILRITGWDCPAGLPAAEVPGKSGRWRIAYHRKAPATYWLHRQYADASFYELTERGRTTRLQQRRKGVWKDWMTDDPLYWMAMYRLAEQVKGPRVLVGGLGLGIVLRHLKVLRPDVREVVVVERSAEVAALTWEPLSQSNVLDERFRLVMADFFDLPEVVRETAFDTVLTDFWVGAPKDPQVQELFARTWAEVNRWWPDSKQLYHGLQFWATRMSELKQAGALDSLRPEQVRRVLALSAPA